MRQFNRYQWDNLGARADLSSFEPDCGVAEYHAILHIEPQGQLFTDQYARLLSAENLLLALPQFKGACIVFKRYFLSDARKTLQQAQQCVDRIADVQNLDEGELNIGCTHSFGTILRETMLDFTSRHPNIHLNARFKTMEELMGMLQRQEVDFALSYKPHELFDNVESHVLFDNKLCVFLSESHPLAAELSGCQISLTRMQALKYAMPTRGMQARNLFEMLIDDKGYAFDIRLEINEVNTITDIVRNSHFATVLSRAAVTAQSGLVCVPIDVSGNNIEGCFHILRGKYVKKSVKEFIRILSSKNADNIMLQHWFD